MILFLVISYILSVPERRGIIGKLVRLLNLNWKITHSSRKN